MLAGEKRKIRDGCVEPVPLSYWADKAHSRRHIVPLPARWCCHLCPARNRTTGYGWCSPWTRLPFPDGTGICTKGSCLVALRACSPDFADSLRFWFVLLLGCSWYIVSTDLMMTVKTLIWWIIGVICLYSILWPLNIFSTNHSQIGNPTNGCRSSLNIIFRLLSICWERMLFVFSMVIYLFNNSTKRERYYRESSCSLVTV